MKNTPLLLQLLDLSDYIDMEACQRSFEGIAKDPYVEEGFRNKEIAYFHLDNGEVVRKPHYPLYQTEDHAELYGTTVREYPAFDPNGRISNELRSLIHIFADYCELPDFQTILFQAQRVTTSKELIGETVAEWHQDGTDIMGLICINRVNVTGGESQVAIGNGEGIFMKKILEPGHMIIFDDQVFWHYATPIFPADESQEGYRDIYIISALKQEVIDYTTQAVEGKS